MNELAVTNPSDMEHLIKTCVQSENTRRAYLAGLYGFERFAASIGVETIDRAGIIAWKASMVEQGLAAKTINIRLTAIKYVVRELLARGLMDHGDAARVLSVDGVSNKSQPVGRWLDETQIRRLLNEPDQSSLWGKRDRALLACMVTTALRRAEIASLTMEHLTVQAGQRCLIGFVGKGNVSGNVVLPPIASRRMDEWLAAGGITQGRLFRAISSGGELSDGLSAEGVRRIVDAYSKRLGIPFAPHDLRRSAAELYRKSGAPLDVIQKALRHANPNTTSQYMERVFRPADGAPNYVAMFNE